MQNMRLLFGQQDAPTVSVCKPKSFQFKEGALPEEAVAGGVSSSFALKVFREPNIEEGRPLRRMEGLLLLEVEGVRRVSVEPAAVFSFAGAEAAEVWEKSREGLLFFCVFEE